MVGLLVSWPARLLVDCLFVWVVGWLFVRSFGRLIVCLPVCLGGGLVVWMLGCLFLLAC